jgi:hypothetical protein
MGDQLPVKSPIGSTNYQWGMKKTPTDGVSLYQSSIGFFSYYIVYNMFKRFAMAV